MRQRLTGRAGGGDPVDEGDGLVVEGDHAFGVELAEGDLQPGAVATNLVDAVQLEVEELSDAQPDGSGQQQRVRGEAIGGGFERFGESPVGVHGQIAGQWPRLAGMIGPEDQLAGGGVVPAPLGDLWDDTSGLGVSNSRRPGAGLLSGAETACRGIHRGGVPPMGAVYIRSPAGDGLVGSESARVVVSGGDS